MADRGGIKIPIIPIVGLVLGAALLFSAASIFETNTAGYLQVKQAAVTGKMSCQLDPGMYGQYFGDIYTYKEAETFYFTAASAPGDGHATPGTSERTGDQSLPTRFNDGTKAQVSGSLRVLLPTHCDDLIRLHRKFHSMDNVMVKLVYPAVAKALFNTGNHMTAAESYAERRAEFAVLAEDQLKNGIIMTDTTESETTDPITGEKKTIKVVKKRTCSGAKDETCVDGFIRDASAFHEFGISVTNFVIDGIEYPQAVTEQIEVQRKARMNIITQQAQAKEAEARAAKAKAEADAAVAETRAKEEVAKTEIVVRAEAEKAQAVLEATKAKEVAALDVQTAEAEKRAKILRAEGDAEAASKVIHADGALDKKLATLVEINKAWADAYTKQRPTPDLVMGGGSSGTDHNPAASFMQLLTAKAAKDLQVDLGVQKN